MRKHAPPWFDCFTRISVIALLGLAACRRDEPPPAAAPAPSEPALQETQLVVFAAASLRDAFSALGEPWKAAHPGAELTFNFAGTQELRTQLEQGAPVDVFASADQRHMSELVKAGRATAPVLFARNEPVIIVAKEAARTLRGLVDLPSATRLVIGVPEVPIGRYTLQILDKAQGSLGVDFRNKVESKVVSRELNVRQVLNKVKLGEADAGFVYRSDTLSTPEVTVVAIPSELNVIAEYPIAVVSDAKHPKLAAAWLEHVRSEAGQRALLAAGFLAPEATTKP